MTIGEQEKHGNPKIGDTATNNARTPLRYARRQMTGSIQHFHRPLFASQSSFIIQVFQRQQPVSHTYDSVRGTRYFFMAVSSLIGTISTDWDSSAARRLIVAQVQGHGCRHVALDQQVRYILLTCRPVNTTYYTDDQRYCCRSFGIHEVDLSARRSKQNPRLRSSINRVQ